MIIKRLTLHNFGVYAGTNTFEFSNRKPIVLIGGLNGRGKTTFLEAVLLSLYGANSFAYKESNYKTYGTYLRSYININDWTKISYVEIEFSMGKDDTETYKVHREWNGLGKRTKENIVVYHNNVYSDFLTNNWPMFIENILPSALSNFFFFDGEKIAELAVDNTDEQLKESIRSMLGLTVLDVLNNDLTRIFNKISKKRTSDADMKKLQALRNKKECAEEHLGDIDKKITDIIEDLNKSKARLEQLKLEYTAKGGDIVEHQQELIKEKAVIEAKREQNKELLIEAAGSELPFALVLDLLHGIQNDAAKGHKNAVIIESIKQVHDMYRKYSINNSSKEVEDFIRYIDAIGEQSNQTSKYSVDDVTLLKLNELLNGKISGCKQNAQHLLVERERLEQDSAVLDHQLSIDIDEQEVQSIYKQIKTTELHIADCEVALENYQAKRQSANGDVIKTTSEFSKYVESLLSGLEEKDDMERMIKYIHLAQKLIDGYSIRLQKQKVDNLAETITQCYRLLANKKTLIDTIEMDAGTLELRYLNSDGTDVPKEKLSAGEKQLMVISILWALAKCSKKKLPVIIDTPLSRLDSAHRKAIITTYFPNASDQTIILSTDTEIDSHYYEMMKENVGDEFFLNYNDESKSTSVCRGYFGEKVS